MPRTDDATLREIIALRKLSVGELRARWLELFGEETKSRNRDYLFKRLAYRIQERRYGGLTEEERARAEALAEKAPIRRQIPAGTAEALARAARPRDPRLPAPGTVLRRIHGGVDHEVTVLDEGFEYRGEQFKSLSLVATKIAGTKWNGFTFFGLGKDQAA
jgi:hypothetical protein